MVFNAPIQTYVEHIPGDVLVLASSHVTRVRARPGSLVATVALSSGPSRVLRATPHGTVQSVSNNTQEISGTDFFIIKSQATA